VKLGTNDIYTPFPNYDGTSEWNSAFMGGMNVPFRFRMTNTGSLSGKYGSFNWSLPYYSDQFVDRDFMDRSEEMDYVAMLKNDSSPTETETNLTRNIIGSFEWRVGGSSTLSLPFLAPYITSLSVSNISSFIRFNYRSSAQWGQSKQNLPDSTFFYPDTFTIYSISAGVSGTPLSLGGTPASQTSQTSQASQTGQAAPEEPDPFRGLGIPTPPWTEEKATGAPVSRSGSDPNAQAPPAISQRFELPRAGGLRFSIAYQLSPTSATELKFDSSAGTQTAPHWTEAENVDWSDFSSILFHAGSAGNITLSLSDTNNFSSTTLRFQGSGSLEQYAYMNEESVDYDTDAERDTAKIRAMNQNSFNTSAEFTTTFRPFYMSAIWGNTNFQYSIKNLIAKSELKDAAANKPDDAWYDIVWGKWEKDSLEGHKLAANLQASVLNKAQNLSITAEIPPEESSLAGDATIRIWISETSFSGKILDPYDEPIYEALRFTETLRFTNSFSASHTIVYDPEKDEFTSMSSNLTLYGLTASFISSYATTYELVSSSNQWVWRSSTDSSFEPRTFNLAFARTFRKDELFDKRLSYSLGLNTSLALDLQRFTSSSFNFSLNFTLGISKFLEITLGATSSNTSIYRYFRDWEIFDIPPNLPVIGETNIIKDLLNSFRFDSEKLRQDSAFKLKSFNLSLLHHLGDWDAKLDVKLSPYLDQTVTPYQYKFNTEVSFVVRWLPISEIKTEIIRNKDVFEFK
jgi:hypothetical protein